MLELGDTCFCGFSVALFGELALVLANILVDAINAFLGKRPVFDGRSGRTTDVPVYRRDSLAPGSIFSGPAIVAEDETSTYISASFAAHIDASGCIVMDRKDA